MTQNQPEPERVAVPNPEHETDEEFVPPQDGEQGDGELQPGDDSDNPMAGVDVTELEAPDPAADPGQDVADDEPAGDDEPDRAEAYRDRLDPDAVEDAAERLGAQQDS